MTKNVRLSVPALSLAVALSACGSDDGKLRGAEQVDLSQGTGCFSTPTFPAEITFGIGPTKEPLEACARRWRRGEMQRGVRTAPKLVACVGKNGAPLVFPSKPNLCAELNFAEANL